MLAKCSLYTEQPQTAQDLSPSACRKDLFLKQHSMKLLNYAVTAPRPQHQGLFLEAYICRLFFARQGGWSKSWSNSLSREASLEWAVIYMVSRQHLVSAAATAAGMQHSAHSALLSPPGRGKFIKQCFDVALCLAHLLKMAGAGMPSSTSSCQQQGCGDFSMARALHAIPSTQGGIPHFWNSWAGGRHETILKNKSKVFWSFLPFLHYAVPHTWLSLRDRDWTWCLLPISHILIVWATIPSLNPANHNPSTLPIA